VLCVAAFGILLSLIGVGPAAAAVHGRVSPAPQGTVSCVVQQTHCVPVSPAGTPPPATPRWIGLLAPATVGLFALAWARRLVNARTRPSRGVPAGILRPPQLSVSLSTR
jgi:hypothetical protein